MATQRINTIKAPFVEIEECAGDLVIRPWMESAVRAKGEFQFEEISDVLHFRATGDLRLDVPEGTTAKVGSVSGDLMVKNVQGELSINEIQGDAILSNLGMVKINNICGDLSVKNLAGPLSAETVDGDAVLRNIDNDVSFGQINGDFAAYFVNGAVYLKQIDGDINLRTVNGDIDIRSGQRDANFRNLGGRCVVENVQGDIRLLGGLSAGKHNFSAAGDIVVRWPSNAPLDLVAKAAEIRNRLPLQDVKELEDGLAGRLGNGDTAVSLTAGGRILLKEAEMIDEKWETGPQETFEMDFMIDLAKLGERVSAEVTQHMSRMTDQLETHFGPEFAQNISNKVSQQAENAARKAENAAEKARRYAEREAARAERRYQRSATANTQAARPEPNVVRKKTSTEEQLKILKMVEKGTISPEEANTLLEAFEG